MILKDDTPGFSLCEVMAYNAVKHIPWFYRDSNSELQSPQKDFFGFYALKNILRGIYMSLRFIQAGDVLLENRFCALGTFSYYTASFQLLQSFLALNGHVLIELVHGPPFVRKKGSYSESGHRGIYKHPELIIAKLTKENSWKFESRTKTHASRWNEVKPILIGYKDKIPGFFLDFFQYILSINDGEYETEAIIDAGLFQLIAIRHESIYEGFGYDDDVYVGLLNRELITDKGLDLKAENYRRFAVSLLIFCLDEFESLKGSIPENHYSANKTLLMSSVNAPYFEIGEFPLPERDIQVRLEKIYEELRYKGGNYA